VNAPGAGTALPLAATEGKRVPFIRLDNANPELMAELLEVVERIASESAFTLGPELERFEQNFAAYCGTEYGLGVSSGTAALELALRGLGIGPGDEVIVPTYSFIATAEAVSTVGATPVIVDIDPETALLTAATVEAALTEKTRCVIPVHLFGRPVDMDPLLALCRERGIAVIEDACQAHGAEYHGARAGSMGDMGCFSFYPGKNLGAYGEGGMVVTNNDHHARTIRMLRDWGAEKKYHHVLKGYNFRLEGLQGAVLRVKLRHLENWTEARRARAAHYDRVLSAANVAIPSASAGLRHVYHIYAIRVADRAATQAALAAEGIQTGIHYPFPVHLLPAYADLGYRAGDFPHSERAANEVLSLPMYPELTAAQQDVVADALKALSPSVAA